MRAWAQRLAAVGRVVPFDYDYMKEGRKRPDNHPCLVRAHLAALAEARQGHSGPVILAGKSMGGRIGCHVALEAEVDHVVCLGYPLIAAHGGKVRDEVLLALRTPVLFVQGTRDSLCPLDRLESVRRAMRAPTRLHVVDAGDHSLLVTKQRLRERGETQDDVDRGILEALAQAISGA